MVEYTMHNTIYYKYYSSTLLMVITAPIVITTHSVNVHTSRISVYRTCNLSI